MSDTISKGYNKPALLVLGAGNDQAFMIKTASSMGIATIAVDANPAAPGLRLADYSESIDFSDIQRLIAYCEQLIRQGVSLSGVSTMGSDIPHLVAAVASHFGWVGPSVQTGEWASNKLEMKRRFAEMNIPVPRFTQVTCDGDIFEAWQQWQCGKVIVKPTDRAGSRGVRIIRDQAEVPSALQYALRYSLNGVILLEEYVDGLQISTESIIAGDFACTPGFADRVYENMDCFWPNIMENGGWLPSILEEQEQRKVKELAERAARAMGIGHGVAKGDIVTCPERGPMIIEMAARLSGGDFSESLVPLATGVNYVRTVIDLAMGREVNVADLQPTTQKAVVNRYIFAPQGRLEEIKGIEWLKALPQCYKAEVYPKIGDQLPVIDSHANRSGVFVLVSENREELMTLIEEVYDAVKFKIDGKWCSVRPCKK